MQKRYQSGRKSAPSAGSFLGARTRQQSKAHYRYCFLYLGVGSMPLASMHATARSRLELIIDPKISSRVD